MRCLGINQMKQECIGHEFHKQIFFNKGIIKLLLRHKADWKLKDNQGITAFEYAQKSGVADLFGGKIFI